MAYDHERELKSLADELEQMRKKRHQPVLVLGSYAGGLYRSDYFLYKHMPESSTTNLHYFVRQQRFKQARQIFDNKNEHEVNEIMKMSFYNLDAEEYDNCLALLVKNNYFYELVSTNIDELVESSFEHVGMREGREFGVFFWKTQKAPGQSFPDKMLSPGERELEYRIIKVFGDHASREYQINRRAAYFENKLELKQFLQELLARDLLILGFDPDLDEALLHLIPQSGGKIWFVGEEDCSSHPSFQDIFKARDTRMIMKSYWKYHNIAAGLYGHLAQNIYTELAPSKNTPVLQTPRNLSEADAPIKIYLSYADDARIQVGQLQESLRQLRKHGLIDDWHRGMINAGEDRLMTRKARLANAQVILLGISPGFLFSETASQEIEQAMQRHSAGEAVVIPIHLMSAIGWEKEPFGNLVALPRDNKAISTFRRDRRDQVLENIVSEIEHAIERIRKK